MVITISGYSNSMYLVCLPHARQPVCVEPVEYLGGSTYSMPHMSWYKSVILIAEALQLPTPRVIAVYLLRCMVSRVDGTNIGCRVEH
jgi:hypothetical protein